jgi:PAS domain S-box-containing protein
LTPTERQTLLRGLVRASLDALVTIDARGRVVEFNPAAERIFGHRRDAVLGQLLGELIVPPELAQAHKLGLARYVATRESRILGQRIQLEAIRADGKRIPVELEVIPHVVEENLYFTAFVRDISQQVEAEGLLLAARERAEASNRAKSEFLGSMSHELRTPLTAIVGFADLMVRGSGDPQQRDRWPRQILRNAQHLLGLLNDLLDLSKLEAGEVSLELAEINILTLVMETVGLMAPLAAKEDLDFLWECDPCLPRRVLADPLRVKQVLLNLLSNAIKFTPAGKVWLTVRLVGDGHGVELAVHDTGVGISPEDQRRVFDAFTQAHGEGAGRHAGSGLGLDIARRLTEKLGGTLELESEVGVGSVFRFVLPCDPTDLVDLAELRTEGEIQATGPLPRLALAGLRILVVDDHAAIRGLLEVLLEEQGASVLSAEDGVKGLELIRSQAAEGSAFDLACIDVSMPGMSGTEVVATLRKEGQALPTVALTAHAMSGDRTTSLAAGYDAYLTKPIRPQLLTQTIVDLVRGRRALASDEREPQEAQPETLRVDPRFLELAKSFQDSLRESEVELAAALEAGSAQRVGALAHRLSGVAATYGFRDLGAHARQLDQSLRSELTLDALPLPLANFGNSLRAARRARLESGRD